MKSLLNNKMGRFIPFWILFGIMGILFVGAFITPFKISLDDTFERIETNANNAPLNSVASNLSCTNDDAPGYFRATCFTLGGFMVIFILYFLYQWISAMVNGAKSPDAVFAPRYKKMQQALES